MEKRPKTDILRDVSAVQSLEASDSVWWSSMWSSSKRRAEISFQQSNLTERVKK